MSGRAGQLLELFTGRRAETVGLLEELVVRESPTDDSRRVSALAGYVAGRLLGAGVCASVVPCEGRGDGLEAHVGPAGDGVLLVGHHDTVWPVGTLATRPFARDGGTGTLTGPGVFDMKAGIAVAMAVLEAAARGEVRPASPVSFFLAPDEEMGSEASKWKLLQMARHARRVLVLEPSGDGGAAKVARKGAGTVRAVFHGVPSHAGLEPEKGASALMELCRFVPFADGLADLEVGTSVVPTIAAAGTKKNVVPENAEVIVDYRFWTADEGERVTGALQAYRPRDPRIGFHLDGGISRPPMEPTAESLGLYEEAVESAREVGFALAARRVGGASDGNLTAAEGIPTLDGLGPAGAGAHALHEHVVEADLPRRAALLALLLERGAA